MIGIAPRRRVFALTSGGVLGLAVLGSALGSRRSGDAHDASAAAPRPVSAAPAESLKFREFFAMPVGPRGLQPTPRLIALDGQRVQIHGYMAHAEVVTPGMFILSPLPVELGDADESLADDLPPAVLFVHWSSARGADLPYVSGILELTGVLHVGAQEEADGRVSQVRLELDPPQVQALLRAGASGAAVSPSKP